MMARAAGMGIAAELSSSALKASVASHTLEGNAVQRPLQLPLLLTANLRRSSSTSRLPCLAPPALYSNPSKFSTPLNFSSYRASEYQSLGLSALGIRSFPTRHNRQQQVRGVARAMAAENDLEAWIKETNSKEPVVVYSKSWCPYVPLLHCGPNLMCSESWNNIYYKLLLGIFFAVFLMAPFFVSLGIAIA